MRFSTFFPAFFAIALKNAAIPPPTTGIRLVASNTSAYWSINSHTFSAFLFLSLIAVAICLKNCVTSCFESEHSHGLNLRTTTPSSICSTFSKTIFSSDVLPLPHSPYKPIVRDDGNEYCTKVFARLSANEPRFSSSSSNFAIGKSELSITQPP